MSSGKSLLERLFGKKTVHEEPKSPKAPKKKNEFEEEEKTMDGVVRKLRADLDKDSVLGPRKKAGK